MQSPIEESDYPDVLVVGLGNPILGDDGVGWKVADAAKEALSEMVPARTDIKVTCYALGGLSLMEHLIGYKRAIIIDAVQTKTGQAGQIYDLALTDLPDISAGHLTAAHDTSLQTALKLGREMGASLPSEIHVIGIEADKVYDFSERLSPEVEAAIPKAVELVLRRLSNSV
ncbi:MAG: hydrogenase maturation protease [Candidatus Promineifilaceae bacterium]|jgi:hydrogenase maturation protease